MYDSPIKVFEQIPNIISEINNQKENLVYEAVAKVEVDVDKYELVKALQYDREQYSKGYSDGKIDGAREFAEWLQENVFISGETIVCGKEFTRVVGFLELYAKWQKKGKENE